VKITFLGTGTSQGVPIIACNCNVCQSEDSRDNRLRSSIFIETDNSKIVIDAGPDFRQQMLREKIKDIDAILLTHEHKDHIAGLDDIRAFNFLKKAPMKIYLEKNVEQRVKEEFSYVFYNADYPGVPEMELNTITTAPFTIANTFITPIRVYHYQLPILGFKIKNFAYITDASRIEQSEKEKLKNLDVLVINAIRREPHYSHFNLDQALSLIAELLPQKAFITHVSHKLGLHAKIEQELPKNVFCAYDGLKVTI